MRHAKGIELVPPPDADGLVIEEYKGVTLDRLRRWERLGARCSACQHEAWLKRDELVAKLGDTYLIGLTHRLRCLKCGNRNDNRFLIGKEGRN